MFENEKPIAKDRLNDQVYDRLCSLLRRGEFTPGERVPVALISKAFGVSAMPVREALAQLLAVGVLANVSGRSVGVPILTRDELEDLRDVRLQVETTAVRWAVANSTKEFIQTLNQLLGRLLDAEESRDRGAYIKYNYEFHFSVYRHAGARVLLDIIDTLWLRVSPHLYNMSRRDIYRISNVEHHKLVDAIANGDEDAAVEALVADVSVAYEDLIATLDEDEASRSSELAG